MKKNNILLILLITALLIFAGACAQATPEATEAPEPTAVPAEPTEAPEPTAVPEPTEEPVEEPTEEPEPEETEEVALEDQIIQGRPLSQVWADTCSGCHGVFREGSLGPALLPDRLSADRDVLFANIKDGRPGTSMDPFGGEVFMEDEEIYYLVDYILSEPSQEAYVWGMEETMNTVEIMIPMEDLPDAPTHDGNMDNLMLVTERDNRGIVVFDGDTHTRLGRIESTYRAHGYTFDPSEGGERWVYNLGRDGWLLKVDMYTLQAVAKVRIGIDARGIAISDDGKYVIGGNYIPNTAVIVDTETMQPVKVIVAEGNNPSGEFVASRVCGINQTLTSVGGPYFLMNLKDAGQVWRIDYSDPTFPIVKTENVGEILHEGFLNTDQSTFYVASQASDWMAAIDVETMEIIEKIPAAQKPHPGAGAIWFDSAGVEYAATLHILSAEVLIWDVDTNSVVANIPTAGPGLFTVSSAHSPYVWADAVFSSDAPNTFHAIEKDAPFTVHDIVIEDAIKLVHPEPTIDGNFIYISDWGGDKVYVVDAYTFEVVTVFDDVVTPTGIFNSARRYELLGH